MENNRASQTWSHEIKCIICHLNESYETNQLSSRKEILCNHKSTWICRLFLNYCYESSLIFFPRWNKYTLNFLCVWCIGGKRQASFVVSLYCQAVKIYACLWLMMACISGDFGGKPKIEVALHFTVYLRQLLFDFQNLKSDILSRASPMSIYGSPVSTYVLSSLLEPKRIT